MILNFKFCFKKKFYFDKTLYFSTKNINPDLNNNFIDKKYCFFLLFKIKKLPL